MEGWAWSESNRVQEEYSSDLSSINICTWIHYLVYQQKQTVRTALNPG